MFVEFRGFMFISVMKGYVIASICGFLISDILYYYTYLSTFEYEVRKNAIRSTSICSGSRTHKIFKQTRKISVTILVTGLNVRDSLEINISAISAE